MKDTAIVQCPFLMPGGGKCGDEIYIEWETHQTKPKPTGHAICNVCGISDNLRPVLACYDFEGNENRVHEWMTEYDFGDYVTELLSYKSYCWHSITKDQARDLLDDLAARQAELRTEGE